ncbi:MAG: hypothetical protein JSW11_06890 [Candidatus Heimdallarchaeota archaeon]|nr:MAG: hypothetical protein JSW11_06890 [Candidatus Heimdallarchaeota archaeon]
MPYKYKYIFVYALICVIFSLNHVIAIGAAEPFIDDPIVVLFDEGHGQYFDRSLYSQAISDLQVSKSMKVVFNTGKINSTSLEGIDIFVATNPQLEYTREESKFVSRFLNEGKGLLLLANPLNEDNETLNGRGDIINDFIGYLESGFLLGKFWEFYKVVEDIRPADIVVNEFTNAGEPYYLHLDVNSSSHEILSIDKNITSIVTHTCSIEDAAFPVLTASTEASTRSISGEPGSTTLIDGKLLLMGTTGPEIETGAQVIVGGSSIMFSDLEGPFENYSWYESENNSYFWWNIFDWLAATSPETPTHPPLPPEVLLQIFLLIVGVSSLFLLGGTLSYSIGSGRKISLVKSGQAEIPIRKTVDIDTEPSTVQSGPTSKESRRDRRLKQIKKHQRQRKR